MAKDFTEERVTETWEEAPDFPLRDRFAMQYMAAWLKLPKNPATYDDQDNVTKALKAGWDNAYDYADLAMQAREPRKETDDDRSNENV